MTPMGTSPGAITVRATRSATTRKAPPATSERGITARLEVPTRRRTVCGTMMPTKPMRPLTDTAAAVASEAATTTVIRMRSTGRPRLAASSSPTARTSRARRCSISAIVATTAQGNISSTSCHPAVLRRPRIQEYTIRRLASARC